MTTTQYGIRVTSNRFELFDLDDEDPLEIIKLREQEQEAKKKSKLAEKENKIKDVKQKHVQNKSTKQNNTKQPPDVPKQKEETSPKASFQNDRIERKFTGENRDDRANSSRNFEESHQTGDLSREDRGDKFERREWGSSFGDNNFEGRNRARGRGAYYVTRGGGGGRGGRGGSRQNFDFRGKRDFDRQSGSDKTGVKPVDKRDGFGSRNWGNPRDENADETLNTTPQFPEESDNTWSPEKPQESETVEETTNTKASEVEEVTTVATEEQEHKELTLDEWKALKGPRQKPTYNLRKAGEGEDLTQWKKMYALRKKKDGEEEEDDDEYEYDCSEYPQRVGRQKHLLDIDIHFKDMRGITRGRGGRGGRGGNRMPYQGNLDSSTNPSHNSVPKVAPKVDDEHDFPSLS